MIIEVLLVFIFSLAAVNYILYLQLQRVKGTHTHPSISSNLPTAAVDIKTNIDNRFYLHTRYPNTYKALWRGVEYIIRDYIYSWFYKYIIDTERLKDINNINISNTMKLDNMFQFPNDVRLFFETNVIGNLYSRIVTHQYIDWPLFFSKLVSIFTKYLHKYRIKRKEILSNMPKKDDIDINAMSDEDRLLLIKQYSYDKNQFFSLPFDSNRYLYTHYYNHIYNLSCLIVGQLLSIPSTTSNINTSKTDSINNDSKNTTNAPSITQLEHHLLTDILATKVLLPVIALACQPYYLNFLINWYIETYLDIDTTNTDDNTDNKDSDINNTENKNTNSNDNKYFDDKLKSWSNEKKKRYDGNTQNNSIDDKTNINSSEEISEVVSESKVQSPQITRDSNRDSISKEGASVESPPKDHQNVIVNTDVKESSSLSVVITHAITQFGSKGVPYVLYCLEITNKSSNSDTTTTWRLGKRYSHFVELHDSLKSHLPKNIKPPKKKFFGNLDTKFIEERRLELQEYLRKIMSISSVTKSNIWGRWLIPTPDDISNKSLQYHRYSKNIPTKTNTNTSHLSTSNDNDDSINTANEKKVYDLYQKMNLHMNRTKLSNRANNILTPIFSFIDEVFDLTDRGWLEKQASWVGTMLLELSFNGVILKLVNESIDKVINEEIIIKLINVIIDAIWNNESEFVLDINAVIESRTKSRANVQKQIPSYLIALLGENLTRNSADILIDFLQEDEMVTEMIIKIIDALIIELFPAIASKL